MMQENELHLTPKRNPFNGQFLKGHSVWNKGKKWAELNYSQKGKETILKNLAIGREIGRIKGKYPRNAYKILMFKKGERKQPIGVFESSNDASRKTGINARNIRNVAEGKRPSAGNFNWVYEKDLK